MTVKRKFSRSGNGWSIFIPKTILELMEANPEKDRIELDVINKELIVRKIQNDTTVLQV